MNNRRAKLAIKVQKLGVNIFKCQFPKCCNFFTNISYMSIKYCKIHDKLPSGRVLGDRSWSK